MNPSQSRELEKRLRETERDLRYTLGLLERADDLIVRNNRVLGLIRREFVMLLLVSAAAGVVLGICLARLVWNLS